MPDPSQRHVRCAQPNLTRLMRGVTGAREDVALGRPVRDPPSRGRAVLGLARDGAAEVAGLLAAKAPAALLVHTALGPLASGLSYLVAIDDAIAEGDRQNQVHHRSMLEGALDVFEGRRDDASVENRVRSDPGYATGVRRAERLYRTDPDRFAAIAHHVRARAHAGSLEVVEGSDHGEAFEARYRDDLAYQHGVDHMRRVRETHETKYASEAADLIGMRAQIERHRCWDARP